MAYEIPVFDLGTLVTAADLSANQFQPVKVDGNGKVALCSAAGEAVVGVLQDKPGAGQVAQVRVAGVTKAKAGAAFSAGALLKTNAAGKVIAAAAATVNTSDAGTAADPVVGSHVLGLALEPATGADQIVSVLLLPMGAVPTTAA